MRLNIKMFQLENNYPIDIEIEILKSKKNIFLKVIDESKPQIFLYPVMTDIGIKLEKIIFPINGKVKNNKYIFYFNYILKVINIKETIDNFPDFFISKILDIFDLELGDKSINYFEQDVLESIKLFYDDKFEIENFINTIFQLPLKLKNLLINSKNIPNNLIDLYQINNEIMYNGQYFNNIKDLIELKSNNKEYKYLNKIKNINGIDFLYTEDDNINNCILYNDFYLLISKYINNLVTIASNKFNNLSKILINFYENNLSEFQLILFIISNNLQFTTSSNYYKNILNQTKEILEIKNFITIDQININDLQNLKIFLNKYNKFKEIFYKNNIPKINFTLNFNKKNLEENLLKILYIYEDSDDILKYFKPKIRYQMENILSKKLNFSIDKSYKDYSLRLYYKLKVLEDKSLLESFNKFNLFRNIFYKIKWDELVNNYELINLIHKNSNILLYYGKINNVIFQNNNFKDIINIIKNKFTIIKYLDNQAKIYDFILYNYSDLGLILENFQNLSDTQIRELSKIIYLSKFIGNYDSNEYNNFINKCYNCNFIISNNKFNLRIKDYLDTPNINYGKIVRDIKTFDNKKKIISPMEENIILKKLYLKYRKKYSKYKAKYFLEKNKNDPFYKNKFILKK